jgi:nitroreductase
MSKLNLTADEVLSTTRAVRKRLDFDRPVPLEIIKECLQIALQAPSGSNSQGWHFVLVTDREKIAAIAALYQQAFAEYITSDYRPDKQHTDNPEMAATQQKVQSSAQYLSDNLSKVPALLIPCSDMRPDIPGLPLSAIAGITGSLIPAVWSFMLAARERGIGTCWTTLHLEHEKAVAELLDIPDSCGQMALIPIAYTLGTDFKVAQRKSLDGVLHHNGW